MGVWSTSLYGDDISCDIRDLYISFLKQQMSNEEAFQKVCDEYSDIIGTEEEYLFWYPIADTQWKTGRLIPEVKNKVLNLIDQEAGIFIWEEDVKKKSKWRSMLQNLKSEIESPMLPEKKFRKPVEFITNPWNTGDVYAYQFHTDFSQQKGMHRKYILFRKIGDIEYYEGTIYSIVQVFDRVFNSLPTINEIDGLRFLPLVDPFEENGTPTDIIDYIPSFNYYLQAVMIYYKKPHYPKNYFTFIGNRPVPYKEYKWNEITSLYFDKNRMEDWLIEYYLKWRNIPY